MTPPPRSSRVHPVICALLVMATAAVPALGQSGRPDAARTQPRTQAAAQPRPTPDPRGAAALEASRAAVAKLSSLAYTATIIVKGETPIQGDVLIKKADAGGWKLYARTGDGDAARVAAYDGLSVRAMDDEHKIVWEQSTEKIRAMRAVFARQKVEQGVIWELLGDEDWLAADIDFQNSATIDGVPCEVITLRAKVERSQLPPTAPAAPAGGDGAGQSTTNPPQRPDSSSTQEVRLFLSTADHLPRRIIRKSEPGPGPVTINLSAFETDKAIPDSYFNIDTPSGYTVKAANPSPTPKPDGSRTITRRPDPEPGAPASFGLAIGSEAPAFTLQDASGRTHTLADYKGKVVVLDFWGSWCPPCRAAMPGIQKLHEKYKDKPVAVLGLNFEQSAKADPAKFMQEKGFTYGLLLKAETIARDYKIAGWPTFYILDPQGRIAWSAIGHDPSHEAQMAKVIDDLLSK
ncbi:MAG: TlpA family protein disulfide reductase [Phycisphaerales bacterium]|nr:TlpA family protein disulfide reductase [Phycisphaerales bacterium]